MRNSLFLFVVMGSFLSGCSNVEELRGRSPVGSLSKAEYERLETLNNLQQDNIDAREQAFNNLISPAVSEKSKAMAEKLVAGCVRSGHIPDNDMTGAINEQTINGGNCPIYWFRRRNYSVSEKTMSIADNLVIDDPEYRKNFSPMLARSYAGSYRVTPVSNGYRVSGVIQMNEFSTVALGRLQGSITVDHTNKANDGAGHVTLLLSTGSWRHSAMITWTLRRGAVSNINYSVDNFKVERNAFFTLFSAYELDKIMDNALRMK